MPLRWLVADADISPLHYALYAMLIFAIYYFITLIFILTPTPSLHIREFKRGREREDERREERRERNSHHQFTNQHLHLQFTTQFNYFISLRLILHINIIISSHWSFTYFIIFISFRYAAIYCLHLVVDVTSLSILRSYYHFHFDIFVIISLFTLSLCLFHWCAIITILILILHFFTFHWLMITSLILDIFFAITFCIVAYHFHIVLHLSLSLINNNINEYHIAIAISLLITATVNNRDCHWSILILLGWIFA